MPPQTRRVTRPRARSLLRHEPATRPRSIILTEQPGPGRMVMVAPPATPRDAEWVLARPLRPPDTGNTRDPSPQRERKSFLAPDDLPPLAGVQLVRPRRCAALGAPAGPPPTRQPNPAAARKIPMNNQASPATTHRTT